MADPLFKLEVRTVEPYVVPGCGVYLEIVDRNGGGEYPAHLPTHDVPVLFWVRARDRRGYVAYVEDRDRAVTVDEYMTALCETVNWAERYYVRVQDARFEHELGLRDAESVP